jgi:hypothetical protein
MVAASQAEEHRARLKLSPKLWLELALRAWHHRFEVPLPPPREREREALPSASTSSCRHRSPLCCMMFASPQLELQDIAGGDDGKEAKPARASD